MSIVSMSFFVMLLAVSLLPFLLVYQITSLAHSAYRNSLWLLRDRITDDLRREKIARSRSAEAIHRLIENQIQLAGRHTLADSLLAISVFEVEGGTSIFDEMVDYGVSDADRKILLGYLKDFQRATVKHLMWGSVFGWAVLGLLRSLTWVVSLARRSYTRLCRTQIRRRRRLRDDAAAQRPSDDALIQEWLHKVERAEVEIMPEATPSRRAKMAGRGGRLADAGVYR